MNCYSLFFCCLLFINYLAAMRKRHQQHQAEWCCSPHPCKGCWSFSLTRRAPMRNFIHIWRWIQWWQFGFTKKRIWKASLNFVRDSNLTAYGQQKGKQSWFYQNGKSTFPLISANVRCFVFFEASKQSSVTKRRKVLLTLAPSYKGETTTWSMKTDHNGSMQLCSLCNSISTLERRAFLYSTCLESAMFLQVALQQQAHRALWMSSSWHCIVL